MIIAELLVILLAVPIFAQQKKFPRHEIQKFILMQANQFNFIFSAMGGIFSDISVYIRITFNASHLFAAMTTTTTI